MLWKPILCQVKFTKPLLKRLNHLLTQNKSMTHDRMQQRTFKMTIFLTLKALKKNTAPQHHSTTTLLLSLLLGCCWSGDSSAVEWQHQCRQQHSAARHVVTQQQQQQPSCDPTMGIILTAVTSPPGHHDTQHTHRASHHRSFQSFSQ